MIIPFEDPLVQCISGGGFRLTEKCGPRSFIVFPAAIKAIDRRAQQIVILFDKDIVIQITSERNLDTIYSQITACLGV